MGARTAGISDGLFVELVRSANELSPQVYQQHVLELIRPICSFDSVMWGAGTFAGNAKPVYHSMTLHGIPGDEVMREHGKVADNCAVSAQVIKLPDTSAVAFNLKERTMERRFEPYLRYADRYAFKNVLCVTAPHDMRGAVNFIALWRGSDRHRYRTGDVHRLAPLLQCAVQLGVTNSKNSCLRAAHGTNGEAAHAIANIDGTLQFQDARFTALLLDQWPDYSAPFLPDELQKRLSAGKARFVGNQIVVSSVRQGGRWFMMACENKCMSLLTPAQLEIVELVATGCSNKEAAARLAIKEKTVRNQLTEVYKRLNIAGETRRGGAANAVERENWKRAALILWWARQIGPLAPSACDGQGP
jgi:hypothetical protein